MTVFVYGRNTPGDGFEWIGKEGTSGRGRGEVISGLSFHLHEQILGKR